MQEPERKSYSKCAECGLETQERICMTHEGKASKNCPTLTQKEILMEANKEYESPGTYEFARKASIQEADCYANRDQKPYVMQPTKTRIVEICEFAEKMSFERLGLAFCIGLAKEAGIVEQILKGRGFEVVSVLCKAGRTSKNMIGITDDEKIYKGTDEAMCNPIFQAQLLNQSKTELNIVLGLCVGHDSLFLKYAEAPCTVLAAKDRLLGHNPLAAIYNIDSYYRALK